MTPDFVFSTIPSGSTRLTVASLYSLPFNVLKSSAKTAEMKERIEKVSTFVLIVELMGGCLLLCYFGLVRSRRIPGRRSVWWRHEFCVKGFRGCLAQYWFIR